MNRNSTASTSPLTQSSSIFDHPPHSFLPDTTIQARTALESRCSLSCSAVPSTDDYPLIANSIPRNSSPLTLGIIPYVTAFTTQCVPCEANLHANTKSTEAACLAADLKEVRQQKVTFQDMEVRLLVLMQGSTHHDMGNQEEEIATHHVSKKISVVNGSTAQTSSAGSEYTSPARISKSSNKRTQLSSPSAHYATGRRHTPSPDKDLTTLMQYFEPDGGSEQALSKAVSLTKHVSLHKRDQINYNTINNFGGKGVKKGVFAKRKDHLPCPSDSINAHWYRNPLPPRCCDGC
jgi:hypothetical protein